MSSTLARNQFDAPAGESKIELRLIHIGARAQGGRAPRQANRQEREQGPSVARALPIQELMLCWSSLKF